MTGGVLVADQPGLGKTVQALAVLAVREAFPAVVVCPASLKLNWRREVARWLPGRTSVVVSGVTPIDPGDVDVIVVNYDILDAHADTLPVPAAVIFDESHYIKNGSAQRTRAAIRLSDRMTSDAIRLCLSGTPIVNHPAEIVTQLRVLHRLEEFGGARAFRRRYGTGSNLAELNRRLRATCYLRRRKEDVLTELPPKRWSPIVVEGDDSTMRDYRRAESDIVAFLVEQARSAATEAGATDEEARRVAWEQAARARAAEHLVAITALKRLAARAKLAAVRQWVEDFTSTGSKLIVFAHHRDVVDILADEFANGCVIRGGDDPEMRQAAVDRFQNDDAQRVIVCSLRAAGVGLTMTAASDVLFVEQGWTPAEMDQAADRAHRIGQTDSVTAWTMIAADTIDETIAELIDSKRLLVDAATDGGARSDEPTSSVLADLVVRLTERGLAPPRG